MWARNPCEGPFPSTGRVPFQPLEPALTKGTNFNHFNLLCRNFPGLPRATSLKACKTFSPIFDGLLTGFLPEDVHFRILTPNTVELIARCATLGPHNFRSMATFATCLPRTSLRASPEFGFRVSGVGFRAGGLGFGVEGFGFWGVECRV